MPLNQTLYNEMLRAFGKVSIASEGIKMSARLTRKNLSGKLELEILQNGEQYNVDCPFCNDRRRRLSVSHMWRVGFQGVSTDTLVHCYNEDCLSNYLNRKKLIETLSKGVKLQGASVVGGVEVVPVSIHPWPGYVIPINAVPLGHPVREYLCGKRGFDLDELANVWDVKWITNHTDAELLAFKLHDRYRLLFPIYGWHGTQFGMIAWQLRYFDPLDSTDAPPEKFIPKYYTRGKVKQIVYNAYRAKKGPAVCLGEGVMDAIKFGCDIGVCSFGKSLSLEQQRILWANWGHRGAYGCIAYDQDIKPEDEKKLDTFFQYWPFRMRMEFAEGLDPGDYQRSELRSYLIARGVPITNEVVI